ncbi:Noc2p family-domain-containing protein [Umbelopsis sp. PMI_123]|nr:Noc2p family-domain-containing protein [Umbelopsis sp. PMI_123]
MAKLKKSTVKFQKNHLKQTIERRKKQQKLNRAYKKRQESRTKGDRHSNENGHAAEEKTDIVEGKKSGSLDISKLNVNDFLNVDCLLNDEEALDLTDDKEADLVILDTFKGIEDIDLPEQAEDPDEEASDDEMGEAEEGSTIVTKKMLQAWVKTLEKFPTINSLKDILLTFRAMSLMDDKYDASCCYQVNSETVFMKVLATVLDTAPLLINANLVPKKQGGPTSASKWSELQPVARLYCNSLLRILHDVADDELYEVLLEQLDALVSYIAVFPQARKAYIKILLKLWSSPLISSPVRLQCMKNLCSLSSVPIGDKAQKKSTLLSHVLKCVYITYARKGQQVSEESASAFEEMRTSAVNIYRANDKHAFHHAAVYVQQLSQHLDAALKSKTKESMKVVLSWQYLNCLKFWATIIGVICSTSAQEGAKPSQLTEIIYPLVQICTQLIRLNPSVQFLPLRFHLIRMLMDLAKLTETYIPLAPYLFELFNLAEVRNKAKSGSLPPLDWTLIIKAPKEYLHGKVYQNEILKELHSCLIEYYACYGLSIAFPELAVPAVVELSAQQERAKNPHFMRQIQTLKEKASLRVR